MHALASSSSIDISTSFRSSMASKETNMKKRRWSSEEDDILRKYVEEHGEGQWHLIEENSILPRSGKSCRLRWLDHLRPDLKKAPISTEEEELLIELHKSMGNKWSQIAKHFPGRTDNELKNFWHKLIRRRGRGTGLAVYPVDDGSHQNHHQQIDPYIISINSTAADEDRTGCSSKRLQKCDRNSTCLEAFDLLALEFEWPNMDEDFFDSFEFDEGNITFPDLSLDNSVAGFKDEHFLNELLEETWLKENYLAATSDFMSEDEIATPLKPDFYHEFEMQLSETFESHSGDTAKEALPITTMEESLEQIFSSRSWIEIFPAGYLAVDNGLGTHFTAIDAFSRLRAREHLQCGMGMISSSLSSDSAMAAASGSAKICARQRWTPTPMQLQILDSIFYQGSGSPSKQGIKEITAKLAEHGQISETNVYNWFQNRRARSKRKQQANAQSEEEAESLNPKKARTEKLELAPLLFH